jgi:glycosyltransferase involved in cell wall biosynthesis
MSRKADLLIRPDFQRKAGGDVVLASRYTSALRAGGAEASLRPLTPQNLRRGSDTVHLFNVDRLVEFGAAGKVLAAYADRPLVVSPIHHPANRVEYFETYVRTGPLGFVARLGRGPVGRERIKHVLRFRSPRGIMEALRNGGDLEPVRQMLKQARLILVQAEGELLGLESTFGISLAHNTKLARNGVDVDPSIDTTGTRDIDVLVVGRIEERKNQLRLAESLLATPWKVVFVGAINPRSRALVQKFRQVLNGSANLQHVGHTSLPELRQLYARSRVCASASYFEVVSLAELESVGYGCQLVGSRGGYMAEYLGEHATLLEPTASNAEWLQAVAEARACGVNHGGMDMVRSNYSWRAVGERVVRAYADAGLLD